VSDLNEQALQVLEQIFSGTLDLDDLTRQRDALFPDYEDVNALAAVISRDASEEECQAVLRDHPRLLLGAMAHGQANDLAFLTKPAISSLYVADFAVLSYEQGGCQVTLVEIEPASASLLTNKLTPAKRLQQAMGQVRDWDEWMRSNATSCIKDMVQRVVDLPVFPAKAANGSFLIVKPPQFRSIWRDYDGFDSPVIQYAILIGRWSLLSERERARLRYLNQHDARLHRVWTYDQLARRAIMRPAIMVY
jgi:hypothetical protein